MRVLGDWTGYTSEDAQEYVRSRRNWGRWGADDQVGALNLITAEKRVAAARLVLSGRSVSLARELPKTPATNNPRPVQHYAGHRGRPEGVGAREHRGAGVGLDFLGVAAHGMSVTHLDALSHAWDSDGMWNGRDGFQELTIDGARWGGIQAWSSGVFTRGILLDVPAFRGVPYVELEEPVLGDELVAIMESTGLTPQPGDALVVYSGREKWSAEHGEWGSPTSGSPSAGAVTGEEIRSGLHASCLEPIREWDVSLVVWDMLDHSPNEYGLAWSVHAAIFAFGVGLLDNALLEPLAEACREEGRFEFLLTTAPLVLQGGTGSPVNPIAVF